DAARRRLRAVGGERDHAVSRGPQAAERAAAGRRARAARGDALQFWDLAHWDPAAAILLIENFVKPVLLAAGDPDPAQVAKGTEMFNRAATVLEGQLKGRRYVTGDALTLADFALGAPLNYAAEARFPLDNYPEIRRWHASLMALPAWRRT